MRPSRKPGETSVEYMARLDTYWQTDEGKADLAEEAERFAAIRSSEERDRERARHAAEETTLAAMEIPSRLVDLFRSGPLRETEAMRAIEKPRILVLSGNPGCGKTVAAANWLFLGRSGLFVKSSRLARWDRYDDEAMNKLLRAPRLVVDDLGTEFQDAKGNFDAILDEIIDVRYDNKRPTVITTNLAAEAFKARYGERIADRIREAGRFVSLAEKSMRGAG